MKDATVCPKGTIRYCENQCLTKEQTIATVDQSLEDVVFPELRNNASFDRYEPDTGYGGGWTLENVDKVRDEFTKDMMRDFHFKDTDFEDVNDAVTHAMDSIEKKYDAGDEEPTLNSSDRKEIAEELGGTIFAYKQEAEP